MRAIVNQTNVGTISKAKQGKLLGDGVEHIWAFLSASIPSSTELNWTKLKPRRCYEWVRSQWAVLLSCEIKVTATPKSTLSLSLWFVVVLCRPASQIVILLHTHIHTHTFWPPPPPPPPHPPNRNKLFQTPRNSLDYSSPVVMVIQYLCIILILCMQ